jgi:transposase
MISAASAAKVARRRMMARWATAPMDRQQALLFCPTLDAMIADDHPVRWFDELLATLDWSGWENQYVLVMGQPPIPPRVVAGVLLYGLSHGLRSSRRLEWACRNALDFLWLAEGRPLDHSTLCEFRTRFAAELKGLFRQLGRLAMKLGLVRLNQVALDGTRVLANSSRHGTASAKTLTERLTELDRQIEAMLTQAEQADQKEDELFGSSVSPNHLPRDLANLKRRQERLRGALKAAQAQPVKEGKAPKVPVADPQATIQPNKEGGFAPNYTPVATTDGQHGLIVDTEVLADHDEGTVTVATADQVAEHLGQKPQTLLADSAHGSGENLSALAQRGVAAYIPLSQREDQPDNPARRDDLRVPVAEKDWAKLPRNSRTHKLDRAAFGYRADEDCYWCPQGHRLEFRGLIDKGVDGRRREYRQYRCGACGACPLKKECLAGQATARTVSRDAHEPLREQMDTRLAAEEGKKIYARRSWIAETPFAVLKTVMNFRRFLLRGLEKVKTEWRWACTGYNLRKLVTAVSRMRVGFAALSA